MIVCISAIKTRNAVEMQDFYITLILLSKEHVYCCTSGLSETYMNTCNFIRNYH